MIKKLIRKTGGSSFEPSLQKAGLRAVGFLAITPYFAHTWPPKAAGNFVVFLANFLVQMIKFCDFCTFNTPPPCCAPF